MAKAFELKDRRRILVRFIESLVMDGISISDYVARPLNYFNYSYLIEVVNQHDIDNDSEPEYLPLKS